MRGAEVGRAGLHARGHFGGQRSQVASGATASQFLGQCLGTVPAEVLAALVNRRVVMLDFPLRGVHVELEAVRSGSRAGFEPACRPLRNE
jgi:hypothetical protein